jgi:ABC-type sugar transport system ATPase subunit
MGEMNEGSGLLVRNVSLSISDDDTMRTILDRSNLSIATGETLALLGTSGSGKTSLLRIIAGLQKPDTGRVFIDNVDVTNLPPEARNVSMLFQEPALFPGKTTMENAIAARIAKKLPRKEINEATAEIYQMMDQFQLTLHRWKQVSILSGGEFQRAAIVRCIANATRSKLLLLDEPFQSNLNLSLRWALMEWLKDWLAARQLSCLLVTHDFSEAAFFANRIAVIDEDKHSIITGNPETLYNMPPNLAVARIVGPVNLWELQKFNYKLPVPELQYNPVNENGAEWCLCRPSNVIIDPKGSGFEVKSNSFLGAMIRVELISLVDPNFALIADIPPISASMLQKTCGAHISRDNVSFYDDHQERIIGANASHAVFG